MHDVEEQRRLEEGADALLNLAGIATARLTNHYASSGSSSGGSSTQSTPLKRTFSDMDDLQSYNGFTGSSPAAMVSGYYGTVNQTYLTHSYSTPPKKHKSRMLKAKLKRKAAWLR